MPFLMIVSAVSCEEKPEDNPHFSVRATFVNESSHIVAVDFDRGTSSWYLMDDFSLKPGETCKYHYEGMGVVVPFATVTFDEKVSIVHRVDDFSEGLRNMCHGEGPWWEYYEKPKYTFNYTYRFTDADYEFALKAGSKIEE